MNLWMIILVSGHLGAWAGPLPYDLSECQDRARSFNKDVEIHGAAKGIDPDNFQMICVFSAGHPKEMLGTPL